MNALTKIKDYGRSAALVAKSFLLKPKPTVWYEVAYISQFASPSYAEKVLITGIPAGEDPNWQKTGAATKEEYIKWVTTICGMACTAMALNYFTDKNIGTITLAREAQHYNVYQSHSEKLSGLRYHEYVKWITVHSLQAKLYRHLTLLGIRHLLSQGQLVMASVNPNIRGVLTVDDTQIGGHLVLVVGYTSDSLIIHNPSGFQSNKSQSFHKLSNQDFKTYFAGRGIAIQARL